MWIYLSFLILIPTVVISQGYNNPDNDWGVGGSIAIYSVMFGLPLLLISVISGFFLAKSREEGQESLISKLIGVAVVLAITLLFAIIPLKRYFDDLNFRIEASAAKLKTSLSEWSEGFTQGNDCTDQLTKKVTYTSTLNIPSVNNYDIKIYVTYLPGSIAEHGMKSTIYFNQATRVILDGGHTFFTNVPGGNYPVKVEISPCSLLKNEVDYTIGVEVDFAGAPQLSSNELLSKSTREVGSIFHSRKYQIAEFK